MAGDLSSLAVAPARTSAAPAPKVELVSSGTLTPAGKIMSGDGQKLPAAPPVQPFAEARVVAAKLNELLSKSQRSLRFEVDETSGRTVITVINPITKEIVRQIPPEEMLAMAREFDRLGALIDVRA